MEFESHPPLETAPQAPLEAEPQPTPEQNLSEQEVALQAELADRGPFSREYIGEGYSEYHDKEGKPVSQAVYEYLSKEDKDNPWEEE